MNIPFWLHFTRSDCNLILIWRYCKPCSCSESMLMSHRITSHRLSFVRMYPVWRNGCATSWVKTVASCLSHPVQQGRCFLVSQAWFIHLATAYEMLAVSQVSLRVRSYGHVSNFEVSMCKALWKHINQSDPFIQCKSDLVFWNNLIEIDKKKSDDLNSPNHLYLFHFIPLFPFRHSLVWTCLHLLLPQEKERAILINHANPAVHSKRRRALGSH